MNRCLNSYSKLSEAASLHFLPVLLENEWNGKKKQINAMIDSCADRNSLDVTVARELDLQGKTVSFALSGGGGVATE